MMLERIEVESHVSLDDYASFASLAPQVEGLRSEAKLLAPSLRDRTVWMTPWVGGGSNGGVERPERILELSGATVAIGIEGRAGAYVDNLTLLGAEMTRVAGTAVAKSAGRGSRSAAVSA